MLSEISQTEGLNNAWFHLGEESESQTGGKRLEWWLSRTGGGIMEVAVQKVQISSYTR